MAKFTPTPEQMSVIKHESGHARVLAVAGSGKTATMVLRIQYLIRERGVDPRTIRTLMFNSLAKKQFDDKLDEVLDGNELPFVSTFHGFAYQFIQFARKQGLIEPLDLWTGEEEERVRMLVHKCIRVLERNNDIPADTVDVDDALEAIGLWKGTLITPENAGHKINEYIPQVYSLFESERRKAKALTFDDFIPVTVRLLEHSDYLAQKWCNRYSHLIIDEYQDVNYGQQRLIELLAGEKAEVMVIGDDDQTIYEWRGARPSYIIRDFQHTFDNKPHAIYRLTRTFRFGPMVAQVAQNTISHNSNRVEKEVVSFFTKKKSEVFLRNDSTSGGEVNNSLADDIKALLSNGVSAEEIWVLGRMFVQLSGLQMACLLKRIPFRVLGSNAFFDRTEIRRLVQYIHVAQNLNQPITAEWRTNFIAIMNVPSRKIRRKPIFNALRQAQNAGVTGRTFLTEAQSAEGDLYRTELQELKKLTVALDETARRVLAGEKAAPILEHIIEQVDYNDHFTAYYGDGEASHERIQTVKSFIQFVSALALPASELEHYIASLDVTLGQSPENLVTFTTTYRTKGLEFDHVFIPDCIEGFMPCLSASESLTYDKSGTIKEADASLALEAERRLFYVAITRGRKSVSIGFTADEVGFESKSTQVVPSRFIEEMQLDITSKMFSPVFTEGFVDGQKNTWEEFVEQNAGEKKISRNLSHYLGEIGSTEEAEWVGALAERVDVAKFKYTRTYRNVGKVRERVAAGGPKPVSIPEKLL